MSLIDEQDRRDAVIRQKAELQALKDFQAIEKLLEAHWEIYVDEDQLLACWALEEAIRERFWCLPPTARKDLRERGWHWLGVLEAEGPPK